MNTAAVAFDSRHAARQRLRETLFRGATLVAALLVLTLLGGGALSLLHGSWPAFSHFKFAFLTREIWNPVTDQYGALAPVHGTLVYSALTTIPFSAISFRIPI